MANPTRRIEPAPAAEELRDELRAVWDGDGRREAVEHLFDLLVALDRAGLLEAGRAVLEGSADSARSVGRLTRIATSHPWVRRARTMAGWADAVSSRIEDPRRAPATDRPFGLLELRRRLRDPNVSAGLRVVLDALEAIGRRERADRRGSADGAARGER